MSSLEYFDQVATQWDAMRQSFFSDAVRDKAIAAANVQANALAADIGAGSGFITQGLVARGVKVIAVDQAEAMLEVMRQKFRDVSTIDYRRGDANALPIPDATCDYVFANLYLHHTEEPPRAIAEMARILKSGGVLVITDCDEHSYEFLREEHHDRWLGFRRSDLQEWLTQAGLEQVTVEDAEEKCCANSCGGDRRVEISIFLAKGIKK